MLWSEVDLIVSFGISCNLQTIKWFRQRTFKSVFGKDTHPLRLQLILRCWGQSQGWNANVHLNAGSFWDFWSKVHISLTSWKNCKSCPSYEDQKVSVKRKSKVTIFLLRVSSHSRPFCPLSLIYYRTRVQSLAMLVTNSLTHSLTDNSDSHLVNLIDVTLACEDANSKLVEVVTVADVDDEDRVGNSLL